MFDWTYNYTAAQMAAILCGAFVAFTWLGIFLIRPFLRTFVRRQAGFNNVLSSFLSVYGVFYGILIGLLAVAAFENKQEVERSITSEGATLLAMFRIASAYPEPHKQELQKTLRDYTRFVREEEWPQMRQGVIARGGIDLINQLQNQLIGFEPQTKSLESLNDQALKHFFKFLELRSLRIYSATTGIPGFMWYVVMLGALLNIVMMWLYEMKIRTHLLLSGLLSFFMATLITLVVVLDQPLRGEFGIPPDVFDLLNEFMDRVISSGAI